MRARVVGLADCRDQLRVAQGLWDQSMRNAVGAPVGFPDGIDAAFRPEGFESAVRDALSACPELGLTLQHVDCDEYPCTAWMVSSPGASAASLSRWEAWHQQVFDEVGGVELAEVEQLERKVDWRAAAEEDEAAKAMLDNLEALLDDVRKERSRWWICALL